MMAKLYVLVPVATEIARDHITSRAKAPIPATAVPQKARRRPQGCNGGVSLAADGSSPSAFGSAETCRRSDPAAAATRRSARIAVMPTMTLAATATSCARHTPSSGRRRKAAVTVPITAPSVLMA